MIYYLLDLLRPNCRAFTPIGVRFHEDVSLSTCFLFILFRKFLYFAVIWYWKKVGVVYLVKKISKTYI